MWCPCLYRQPTPVLWSPNLNAAIYSTSLLEGWAPYGCSVTSLSLSPSSSSSSICRVGHHCTFWIEYKPLSLMGKIRTVWLLGVRASMWCQSIKLSWTLALLGCADLCSLWAAPCPWSLGLRFLVVFIFFIFYLILRTDIPFTSSLGHSITDPTASIFLFCGLPCSYQCFVRWPPWAQILSACFHLFLLLSLREHLVSIVPSALLARLGEMFLLPQWKWLKLTGLARCKQWREHQLRLS